MAFQNYNKTQIGPVDSGVLNSSFNAKVDSYMDYENGLAIGRFAKLDTGSIDNLDNSATPKIAGVVLYSPVNAIENGNTYTNTGDNKVNQIEVCSFGLITVEVVNGVTPAKFDPVYAYNDVASATDYGKATTVATNNVLVNGYFNKEVKPNVWEVFVQI